MELESFGGEIQIRRPGTIKPKGQDKDKQKDKADADERN
jgi:hypothetical protein